MKRKYLFLILLTILLLTGCGRVTDDVSRRIVAPATTQIPINGVWNIVKGLGIPQKSQAGIEWIGKQLNFSSERVVIGDYTLRNAGFKIRSVNADDYFLFNHKSLGNEIKFPKMDTNVVTLTETNNFYCELIVLNENTIILEINNYDLLAEKVTAKKNTSKESMDQSTSTEARMFTMAEDRKSGVLLGIRTPLGTSSKQSNKKDETYSYRTIWVAASNNSLHPIVEKANIIFPRKSGFWEIKVSRQNNNGNLKDEIEKHNISMNLKNEKMFSMMAKASIVDNSIDENRINYLGNDYISIESKHSDNTQSISKLVIVPVDSLPNLKPVKLSELIGIESGELAKKSTDIGLKQLKAKGLAEKAIASAGLMENIGLVRNSGHWFFNGRINYFAGSEIRAFDYRINVIPPQNLIFYDELYVKWTDVKSAVPDAIDVFTSPERDIAIVVSKKGKLLVYGIKNGTLKKDPLQTIVLKKGERIIMAEWATGSYVDNWEKTLSSIK